MTMAQHSAAYKRLASRGDLRPVGTSDLPCKSNTQRLCRWNSKRKHFKQPDFDQLWTTAESRNTSKVQQAIMADLAPYKEMLKARYGIQTVKVTPDGLFIDAGTRKLFLRAVVKDKLDARKTWMQQIWHIKIPHVVSEVYEAGYLQKHGHPDLFVSILDRSDGTVDDFLKQRPKQNVLMQLATKILDLCCLMQQQRLVHGDFHLANIMYNKTVNVFKLHIIDFDYSQVDSLSDLDVWYNWDSAENDENVDMYSSNWRKALTAVKFTQPAGYVQGDAAKREVITDILTEGLHKTLAKYKPPPLPVLMTSA